MRIHSHVFALACSLAALTALAGRHGQPLPQARYPHAGGVRQEGRCHADATLAAWVSLSCVCARARARRMCVPDVTLE